METTDVEWSINIIWYIIAYGMGCDMKGGSFFGDIIVGKQALGCSSGSLYNLVSPPPLLLLILLILLILMIFNS